MQGGWGAQRKAAKFRKKGRAADCSSIAADGKARAESLECGSALLDTTIKFRPSAAEASAQLRCKSSKRQREHFCFCAWLSALPLVIDEAF